MSKKKDIINPETGLPKWQAHPKQTKALESKDQETLFGCTISNVKASINPFENDKPNASGYWYTPGPYGHPMQYGHPPVPTPTQKGIPVKTAMAEVYALSNGQQVILLRDPMKMITHVVPVVASYSFTDVMGKTATADIVEHCSKSAILELVSKIKETLFKGWL